MFNILYIYSTVFLNDLQDFFLQYIALVYDYRERQWYKEDNKK